MKTTIADFGNWHIECIPDDGARISVLKYAGHDLLTPEPVKFRSPGKFCGEFETRPVFGYDDCFPTVDPCIYPEESFKCRDHGELSWQKWRVDIKENGMIFYVECHNPEVTFKRHLEFDENKLNWRFEVVNASAKKTIFLHVMHALLPLNMIQELKLPDFKYVADEVTSDILDVKSPRELEDYLFSIQSGNYKMLLLRDIGNGNLTAALKNGLTLRVSFNEILFPTLGVWWNNKGYPDENGIQRTECALEPIPGSCSDLSKSFADGTFLTSEPGKTFTWEIMWTVDINNYN